MHIPTDIFTWFKVTGSLSVGAGSILLAYRVKVLLQWVVYCLVAHEQSIKQLANIASNQQQTQPIVYGVTGRLLDIESKRGFVLLLAGFFFFGIGMFINAASYFFGKVQ